MPAVPFRRVRRRADQPGALRQISTRAAECARRGARRAGARTAPADAVHPAAGELEGRPVSGKGRLRYENRHLADTDIDLNLAGNLAKLKGAYGRAGDRLGWDIDAPALARLNLGLAGRLTSRGSVSGDPAAPQIEATLAASGLRLPGDIAAES